MNRIARMTTEDRSRQGGYAMFAVTVFVFVVIIGAVAVFSTTSSEALLANYEHESTEAFYLADGAVERARARLSGDPGWRDGWSNVTLGSGTYSLTLSDTSSGSNPAVRLVATGRSGRAARAIEAIAELPLTGTPLAVFSGTYLYGIGSVSVYDRAHTNGTKYFGSNDMYLVNGVATTEPEIDLPPMRVDPNDFPNHTYYYVRCRRGGGPPRAMILDGNGVDITGTVGSDLRNVVRYSPAGYYSINFNGPSSLRTYFDDETGVFRRAPGDSAVVINFGEPPITYPSAFVYLTLSGSGGGNNPDITPTIINTRFTGITEESRLDSRYWTGGYVNINRVRLAPRNGIGVVSHMIYTIGGSAVMGTADAPAVTYATNLALSLLSDTETNGTVVSLGSWYGWGLWGWGGSQTYRFNPGFLSRSPAWFSQSWPGVGGTALRIVSWREIPVPGA